VWLPLFELRLVWFCRHAAAPAKRLTVSNMLVRKTPHFEPMEFEQQERLRQKFIKSGCTFAKVLALVLVSVKPLVQYFFESAMNEARKVIYPKRKR
jgi:hypothetical protein